MSLTIRQAKNSDLPALVEMARTAFLQAFIEGNKIENVYSYLEEAFTLDQFTREFDLSGSTFFVAELDQEIVGYTKVNLVPAQTDIHDPESVEVGRLYVLENYLGTGLGLRFLDVVFEFAKEMQKKYVWLGVWEKNHRAIRFYEKHGFHKFSEHPFPFGDEVQTDWLMRKDVS